MAKINEEKKDLTGLAEAEVVAEEGYSKKDAEYNLTAALLEAADFRNAEDNLKEIVIKRGDRELFSFNIHPLSEAETRRARRRATKMVQNPNGKRLPKVEGEFDSARFHSMLIYMATTAEDQQKIWNNEAVKQKYDIMDPVDTVELLLMVGEKIEIVDTIMEISGMDEDDDESVEDYAKN